MGLISLQALEVRLVLDTRSEGISRVAIQAESHAGLRDSIAQRCRQLLRRG